MKPKRGLFMLCLAVMVLLAPHQAFAAVEVGFYSKDFGATFPHAFVTVKGSLDSNGEVVDASYGFTAKSVSPSVLMGSVKGEIVASAPDYIARSDRHFSITIDDDTYRRLLAVVEKWRNAPQPSYNLNKANCVYFVAEMATAIGLKADTPRELMKKPRSYLQALVAANRSYLGARAAAINALRAPPGT